MLNKALRYYHTLKHLKLIQVQYQIWYRFRDSFLPVSFIDHTRTRVSKFKKIDFPYEYESYKNNEFFFLNIKYSFEDTIDWNIEKYGKLWVYNLNYFGFLNQENITKEDGLKLIRDYIQNIHQIKDGFEAYPISLRGINWIKFLMRFEIIDPLISSNLYSQYKVLQKKIEYNLLGNHLIENGFSLYVAGLYLNDHTLLKNGEAILFKELNEQILEDGAHFERSPMYHQIILQRVLDCINISNAFDYKEDCYHLLRDKASLMIGWLEKMSFNDGSIPHFNDSTYGISLSSKSLMLYSKELNIESIAIKLNSCGYRKFESGKFILIVDGSGVEPAYQAAHSHNDAASFVLNYNNENYIVDTGLSTYESNIRRIEERGVASHNTVFIDGYEPSEIWGSFRVGKRENVMIYDESANFVKIRRTLPNPTKYVIEREYSVENNHISIEDRVDSDETHIFNLHFCEHLDVKTSTNEILVGALKISFQGHTSIYPSTYYRSLGYNSLTKSTRVSIHFTRKLITRIETI